MRRGLDNLKAELDKLAKVQNPPGDPSCPDVVDRTKNVAPDIMAQEKPGVVGSSDRRNDDDDDDVIGVGEDADSIAPVTPVVAVTDVAVLTSWTSLAPLYLPTSPEGASDSGPTSGLDAGSTARKRLVHVIVRMKRCRMG